MLFIETLIYGGKYLWMSGAILKVTWNSGVQIEYNDAKVILDSKRNRVSGSAFFISHGHYDHSTAFKIKQAQKYSSRETMDIVSSFGLQVENCSPIAVGEKIMIGDIEVIPHNSGHVLGSFEYEIRTPEGTVLFTGDFNTEVTKTMKPAEPVQCDVLVLEATFGSPSFVFPRVEEVGMEMVEWAKRIMKSGKIPTFQTDPLGNAQEIIRVFNEVGIPVITHWKVTRMTKIYESYGHKLEYFDAETSEAEEIRRQGDFIYITPKNLNVSNSNFETALVSGWALWMRKTGFPLSDHADFPRLVKFVEECEPRIVLTCHGGRFDEILAEYIERKMHIRAYPINLIPTRICKSQRKQIQATF